jgi:LmbE family N-acetylglucosaminyl deacetylase
MADTLTLMAVHAHPDDEASSTGGVLAKYSDEGIRTVVVTCTNGEFGDTPDGVKPGQDGHEEQVVAEIRLAELREACKHLGVTDLELLGYHDSGMPDWEYKDRPDAFCNVPQDEVAGRIGALIELYRPQVVITYDDQGPYQHPDHLHASRCAQAAVSATGIPDKLYLTAMRRSDWRKVWDAPDGGGRAADQHQRRHPPGPRAQARGAARARQPDPRLLVQQDPARDRRAGVRPGELHPGPGPDRRAGSRGRPVRGAPPGRWLNRAAG